MRVLIVGGVAAGMSAAARLRRLEEKAEIIVFEKDEFVSFANCGLPYHIGGTISKRQSLLVQTAESLRESLNIDVRIFTRVTAIHPEAHLVEVEDVKTGAKSVEKYDKLILAPGAKALRPPMPGLEHPAIHELRNIADMDGILAALQAGAKRAVVMGGFIGIEAAENLLERGLEVIIVEKMRQLMAPLDPEIANFVQSELERHGVQVLTGAAVNGFRDESGKVVVMLENGVHIEADLVIFALGSTPFSDLAAAAGLKLGARGGIVVDAQMRTSDPDIFAAGDVVETPDFVTGDPTYVPLAGPANRQGRIAADVICGRDSAYRGTQGTSVLKVFDLTVATTGLNEKALKRAGTEYRKLYLHPFGHVNYYPGTAQMHFKLLFCPNSKRVFGAQIAGYDGVDKRIDVVATAMRGNLTVEDLEHLELAYAPPYGAAKDPVNMAGFIAMNMLRGDVKFWYAEEFDSLPTNAVILDVSTQNEFTTWRLPGAINIPIGELRNKIDTLDKSKLYHLYCKVGIRSYLAHRILAQNGLQSRTLAGGSDILKALRPDLSHKATATPPGRRPTVAVAGALAPSDTGAPPPALARMDLADAAPAAAASGRLVEVDCCGLQCPGPLRRLADEIEPLAIGDELEILASDPGFATDARAWCAAKGHLFISEARGPNPGSVRCRIRKQAATSPAPAGSRSPAETAKGKKTMVIFSGDLDKVMAALVIANGALAMGDSVTLFFTFWGLSALRRTQAAEAAGKSLLDRMFGWMLPRGLDRLKLSQMNMGGAGTAMMKHVMQSKNVDSPAQLLASAKNAGIRLVACSMSMDVMGLKPEELIEGVEIGGVATFLAESDQSNATLFI